MQITSPMLSRVIDPHTVTQAQIATYNCSTCNQEFWKGFWDPFSRRLPRAKIESGL